MSRNVGMLTAAMICIVFALMGCSDDKPSESEPPLTTYRLIVSCRQDNFDQKYFLEFDTETNALTDSVESGFDAPPTSMAFTRTNKSAYLVIPGTQTFALFRTSWPPIDTLGYADSVGNRLKISPDETLLRVSGYFFTLPGLQKVFTAVNDQFNGEFIPNRDQFCYHTIENNTLYYIDYEALPPTASDLSLQGAPQAAMSIRSLRPSISGDSLILGAQYFGDSLLSYMLVVTTDGLNVLDTVPIPKPIPVPEFDPLLHPDGKRLYWIEGFKLSPVNEIVYMYRLDTKQITVVLEESAVGLFMPYQTVMTPDGRYLFISGVGAGGSQQVVRLRLSDNQANIVHQFPGAVSISTIAIRTVD